MAKYTSGRQKNLKVGISSYSENLTSLEVIGKVGIGTTNPTSTLYVVGDTYITGVVTASSYRGDGSLLTGISANALSISTNTTNQAQYIPYATSFGSTTGLGATTLLVYNPSTGNLGIGTTNPQSVLDVRGTISIGATNVSGINSIRSVVDINSWEYGGVFKSVTTEDTGPADIYFKDDGTKMYILGGTGNDVNEYALSTPWNISTAGFTTNFSVATQETGPAGLYFKPDGTRMYICGLTGVSPTGDRVYSYTLSTPWSLASGVTYDNKNFNVGTNYDTGPQALYFKDNGTKMYVVGSANDAVYEYTVSTAWEIDSTVTLTNTLLIGATNTQNLPLTLTTPTGINFNASGTRMFIVDNIRDVVAGFDLSTAWDLSTAVFYDNVYIGFQELTPTGVFYQEDQSKAYVVGSAGDTVYQYNTNVPSLELASSGISTRSSIILNNETRLNNKLYVTGETHISSNTNLKGTLLVDGALTASAAVTADTTTSAINLGTSQNTGTFTVGGTSGTGTITLGRATTTQTTNIQAGTTASGNTKTINLGTGGDSGSNTLLTLGSATAGAISTVTIPSPTNLLIGSATPTGTASQRLQVTGGAVFYGTGSNVGIGTTNPTSKLYVVGDTEITGIATINKLDVNQLSPDGVAFGSTSYVPIADGNGNWGWGAVTGAGAGTLSAIVLKDEGTTKGNVTELNFVGAAITASTSGSTGTITLDTTSVTSVGTLGQLQVTGISTFTNGPVLIGTATSTGTASQRLQVTGGAAFYGTGSNVGIGTTNPTATLQVKDALAFETTNTTTTTTTQVAVDTFATATFRSAKYHAQITCPGQISVLGGITTGGRGYTAGTFNVTFTTSSGNGSAAQGTLTIANGTVGQIGLGTTGGSGYTAGDVLTASGGSGLQVSVGSTNASGAILTLGSITSAGIGYTAGVGVGTTTVSFLGGTGTGAVGLATIFDGVITSSVLLQQPTTGTGGTTYYAGSNYSTASVLTISTTDVTNTIITITGSVGVSTFTSLTAHGLFVNDIIRTSSTSNGLTAGTDYYVVTTPLTTTFTLGTSVGVGTTFTTGSSLSIGFYRNSANAGGQIAYTNAITGVSTNYQVSDLLVLQDGTNTDFIEYASIANNDILGTFAGDISGANARLLFTPTYPNNNIKVARQAITI